MQRFFIGYATVMALFLSVSVTAAEPDRYGKPPISPLSAGDWWKTDAVTPEEAGKHVGKLTVVKGRVLSTFQTREDLYLNFGADYKTDFTVRIPKRAWKQFGDMKGKEITVRGVVREYNGPMIVADFKEQIHAD